MIQPQLLGFLREEITIVTEEIFIKAEFNAKAYNRPP